MAMANTPETNLKFVTPIAGIDLLYEAVISNSAERTRRLVDKNTENVNCPDHQGWTPLHYAAYLGHHETGKILLEHPDVAIEALDNEGWTPLHWANFYKKSSDDQTVANGRC